MADRIAVPADGPSFGNRALRYVQVQIHVFEKAGVDMQLRRVSANPRQRVCADSS